MELSHNSINVYLFVEDIEEYIDINSIKINITENNNPYFYNTSISIECIFDENIFNKALASLKYENVIHSFDRYHINKKDIVSNVILYVSKYHDNNLIKIIELKNAMITSVNLEGNIINLTCDYYIRFNDFLEIEDKDYLYNICSLINIDYNKTYNTPYYLEMPLDHTHTGEMDDKEDYEEIYDDWDDYDYDNYEEDQNNNNVGNIFEKSGKLVSKIFSSFYK